MGRARPAYGLDLRPTHGPHIGPCRPDPQLGWIVPDLCRARNCVLWAGVLGTAQMYTYIICMKRSSEHEAHCSVLAKMGRPSAWSWPTYAHPPDASPSPKNLYYGPTCSTQNYLNQAQAPNTQTDRKPAEHHKAANLLEGRSSRRCSPSCRRGS
jgi:hypothetical protein